MYLSEDGPNAELVNIDFRQLSACTCGKAPPSEGSVASVIARFCRSRIAFFKIGLSRLALKIPIIMAGIPADLRVVFEPCRKMQSRVSCLMLIKGNLLH